MKTLEVQEPNAIKAYKAADSKGKKLLSDLFGETIFSQKVTDRIKTFQDACDELNINVNLPWPKPLTEMEEASNAITKMWIIAEALNEGWKPDWKDSNQYKWYPYFIANSAGFGFSDADFVTWSTNTAVGSRLCFATEELAKYAGTQFINIYNKFL